MWGVQKTQLYFHEEQEEAHREAGTFQVLQVLQKARGT